MAFTVFNTLTSDVLTLRTSSPILTSEVVIPGNTPEDNYAQLRFLITMLTVDQINPLIDFTFAIERQVAPDWRHICGGHWVGTGEIDPGTGLPAEPYCTAAITTGIGDGVGRLTRNKKGWRVRGTIIVPVLLLPLTLGWQIDIVQNFDV